MGPVSELDGNRVLDLRLGDGMMSFDTVGEPPRVTPPGVRVLVTSVEICPTYI